jgi:hypothetical protein
LPNFLLLAVRPRVAMARLLLLHLAIMLWSTAGLRTEFSYRRQPARPLTVRAADVDLMTSAGIAFGSIGAVFGGVLLFNQMIVVKPSMEVLFVYKCS